MWRVGGLYPAPRTTFRLRKAVLPPSLSRLGENFQPATWSTVWGRALMPPDRPHSTNSGSQGWTKGPHPTIDEEPLRGPRALRLRFGRRAVRAARALQPPTSGPGAGVPGRGGCGQSPLSTGPARRATHPAPRTTFRPTACDPRPRVARAPRTNATPSLSRSGGRRS